MADLSAIEAVLKDYFGHEPRERIDQAARVIWKMVHPPLWVREISQADSNLFVPQGGEMVRCKRCGQREAHWFHGANDFNDYHPFEPPEQSEAKPRVASDVERPEDAAPAPTPVHTPPIVATVGTHKIKEDAAAAMPSGGSGVELLAQFAEPVSRCNLQSPEQAEKGGDAIAPESRESANPATPVEAGEGVAGPFDIKPHCDFPFSGECLALSECLAANRCLRSLSDRNIQSLCHEPTSGQVGAEQFYDEWRKGIVYHRVGRLPEWKIEEALAFAEAYAAHVTKGLEARLVSVEKVVDAEQWCAANIEEWNQCEPHWASELAKHLEAYAAHVASGLKANLVEADKIGERHFRRFREIEARNLELVGERQEIMKALCISFDAEIAAEEGDCYEVPAEPEPLYFDTLPKAIASYMAIADKEFSRLEAKNLELMGELERVRVDHIDANTRNIAANSRAEAAESRLAEAEKALRESRERNA